MIILRICKATTCLTLAVFALLVCFNNLVDYDTNYAFVRHTLSMDTVFPGNTLKHRAILDPSIWRLAYAVIIFTELLTGILLLIGVVLLFKNIRSSSGFIRAKNWIYLGCTVGFLLWFLGFIVVAGEWFSMWQSDKWNGIEAAFRFVALTMFTLIFTAMPEPEKDRSF